MNISDALPIQFTPIGGQTYNESVFPFVDTKPFIQEFQTDDYIKLQVSNEAIFINTYTLKILDSLGNIIETENFAKTSLPYGPNLTFAPINDGASYWDVTPPNGWSVISRASGLPAIHNFYPTVGFSRFVTSPCLTDYFCLERIDSNSLLGWPPATYNLSLTSILTLSGTGITMSAVVKIWGSPDGVSFTNLYTASAITGSTTTTITPSITTSVFYKYFAVTCDLTYTYTTLNLSTIQFTAFSLTNSITDANAEYDYSFTAATLPTPIADQQVQFIIQQNGTDIYKSDYIQFSTSVMNNKGYGSKLLQYNSTKNFAGINYPNDSTYFNLRVPCRFYQTQNVKSQTSLPLSNSQIVTTSIVSTRQKYLETVLLPPYMLDKLDFIFQHCVTGSLIIDGIQWQADESFDRTNPDPSSAFQKGKIWLSKDVIRNII